MNDEAFATLINSRYHRVRRQVGKLVPEQDADDVTQDIFLAVVAGYDSFQGRSSFATWVNAILRHTVADYYRKAHRPPLSVPMGEGDSVVDADTSSVEVEEMLQKLRVSYHEVIKLHCCEGWRFVEIAEMMGVEYELVRSRYRRAIKVLRKKWGCDSGLLGSRHT